MPWRPEQYPKWAKQRVWKIDSVENFGSHMEVASAFGILIKSFMKFIKNHQWPTYKICENQVGMTWYPYAK